MFIPFPFFIFVALLPLFSEYRPEMYIFFLVIQWLSFPISGRRGRGIKVFLCNLEYLCVLLIKRFPDYLVLAEIFE